MVRSNVRPLAAAVVGLLLLGASLATPMACSRGDAEDAAAGAVTPAKPGAGPATSTRVAAAAAAPGPTPGLPRPRRVAPPGGHPPVGAVLYVAPDGPHIVLARALGPTLEPKGEWRKTFRMADVPMWEARLVSGTPVAEAAPGPAARTGWGWDGRGWCVVQHGGTRATFMVQWPQSSFSCCMIALDGQGAARTVTLGIPGYNQGEPVEKARYPEDVAALTIFDPSAALIADRLWIASQDGMGQVSLSSTSWGEFEYTDWAPCRRLGKGYFPSIVGDEDRGLFVSHVRLNTKDLIDGDVRGTIAVHHSEDGREWEELPPATDEKDAHTQALALDPEQGLCVVYAAKREGGWPLMAARSADFGQTWGEPVMLTEPTIYASQPQVVAHGGRFYVSYRETTGATPSRIEDPGFDGDPLGIYTLVLEPEQLPA